MNVMVSVDLPLLIPEEKPVLLNLAPTSRPLELRGCGKVANHRIATFPAGQHLEILHELPEAGKHGVRSKHSIRPLGTEENARIMRADVHIEKGEIPVAFGAFCRGYWKGDYGTCAAQGTFLEASLAENLSDFERRITLALLGDDNPSTLRIRVWDDIRVHHTVIAEVDVEESLVPSGGRENLLMLLGIDVRQTTWALNSVIF